MALIKSKVIARGEVITYWSWFLVNRSDKIQQVHAELGGWKNKQERLDYPGQPRETVALDLSGADYPFTPETLQEPGIMDYDILYPIMKASKLDENGQETNWFHDAEDELT